MKKNANLCKESQSDVVESKIPRGVLGPYSRTSFASNSLPRPSPISIDLRFFLCKRGQCKKVGPGNSRLSKMPSKSKCHNSFGYFSVQSMTKK